VGVGGPVAMVLALCYLGIASVIPFIGGLLGFSRRISYVMTAALTCGLIYLDAVTFSDALKYQDPYRLVLIHVEAAAVFAVELLFTFVLAHWLGARLRTGLIWAKNRLPRTKSKW
jgi:hypothetical protein